MSMRKSCLSGKVLLIEHPVYLCTLKRKKAVNRVFTHGSFHWIKARGCCVSLDSHHYACWILMGAAHWGAVLKRTRLACAFSKASGLSITLTICLPAEEHKRMHTGLKRTVQARTDMFVHTDISNQSDEKSAWGECDYIKCYLQIHSNGWEGGGGVRNWVERGFLFKVTVYPSTVKPQLSHCSTSSELWMATGCLAITTHRHRCVITLLSTVHTWDSDHSHIQLCLLLTYPTEIIKLANTNYQL